MPLIKKNHTKRIISGSEYIEIRLIRFYAIFKSPNILDLDKDSFSLKEHGRSFNLRL